MSNMGIFELFWLHLTKKHSYRGLFFASKGGRRYTCTNSLKNGKIVTIYGFNMKVLTEIT